ncbi:MAG: NAD(P) transhydrogenase subunit alpha, partial [Pseudomonadota bacterium]|nr:NAD(P) transhydrogenase subunit alpha [Pseudomonadota bacterium]
SDDDFARVDCKTADKNTVLDCEIVAKINPPTTEEVSLLKPGTLFVSLLNSWDKEGPIKWLNEKKVTAFALEKIPRTSRAQSMDVLSSQANIAGYRAVLEASVHYKKFFPLMMTSAGMSKPAKVIVLGAGVAGLQAIATAKRLGASVEAYDVRPEVKEQIQSLGAKFVELEVSESGQGTGGYAKELSKEARELQQKLLTEYLKSANIIISTANIPGRKAPVLITEAAVRGMKPGSVILDLAAGTGGNCELTKADQTISVGGVTVVGISNYPSLVATDSSQFFGNNLHNFLSIMIQKKEGQSVLKVDFEDDIIAAACVCHQGQLRT